MFSAVYFFSITAHSNLKFPVCSLFSLMLRIMFIKIIFLSRPLNPFSPCVFIMFVFYMLFDFITIVLFIYFLFLFLY